jgi:D-arabinose 1-dehydrogenase-like Zn-dependent alcohol dehydrogenase
VGIGGLGHLGVKFARHLGYEVSVFSSSDSKKAQALEWGAHHFFNSKNPSTFSDAKGSLDMVLVTAAADFDWSSYLKTLRTDGMLCFVGVPPSPLQFHVGEILSKRLKVGASTIASRGRIRQMVDFCVSSGIRADSEVFSQSKINTAIEKVRDNSIRYRAVVTF